MEETTTSRSITILEARDAVIEECIKKGYKPQDVVALAFGLLIFVQENGSTMDDQNFKDYLINCVNKTF